MAGREEEVEENEKEEEEDEEEAGVRKTFGNVWFHFTVPIVRN